MFAKPQRVKLNRTIQAIQKSRYRTTTSAMVFSCYVQPTWQIMTVISRKISKLAVVRNTLRRRILAIIRTHNLHTTLPVGAYQIRLTKKNCIEYEYLELEAEILDGLSKLSKSVK